MVPDFWCCVDPARVELGGPSRYTKDGANTHQHAVLNSAYRLMRGDNTTGLRRNFGVPVELLPSTSTSPSSP